MTFALKIHSIILPAIIVQLLQLLYFCKFGSKPLCQKGTKFSAHIKSSYIAMSKKLIVVQAFSYPIQSQLNLSLFECKVLFGLLSYLLSGLFYCSVRLCGQTNNDFKYFLDE